MIAVDTNVLARFYLNDDAVQAESAAAILAREDVFVPKTVLLELEWVLRGVAKVPPPAIAKSIAHLLGLRNVHVEDEAVVRAALKAFTQGMDFGDALHMASSAAVGSFATFDARLVKRASRSFNKPVAMLP